MGINEEESYIEEIDQIFNRLLKKKSSLNEDKNRPIQIQDAQKTPNRQDQKRKSPQHFIVKTLKGKCIESFQRRGKWKGEML